MQVLRSLVAFSAWLALLATPTPSSSSRLLPLSEESQVTLVRLLRWALALLFAREVNRFLNAWAENRWMFSDDKSTWDWPNEIAVVTGGSGGIGALVAKKLLARGLKVAVLDVESLSDVFQTEDRKRVKLYRCDVSSPQAVHEAAEAIRSDHGSPSILINNAGIGSANTILETTHERLNACFGINLLSQWYTVQEFLPDMIAKRKGHIMSTSSMSAWVGFAGAAEYASTKAGLTVFYEVLTSELKHRYKCPQIKTSIIYPTWTRTRLIRSIEKNVRRLRGPIHDPDDVAETMVQQIIAAKSGQILLGPTLTSIIRASPTWFQEFIRDRMAYVVTGNATTTVESDPHGTVRQL